jgi:hypothetical protein
MISRKSKYTTITPATISLGSCKENSNTSRNSDIPQGHFHISWRQQNQPVDTE